MIFKREKEVARRLEFDGLYVTVQPPDEDIKGQWDRLVINTPYVHSHIHIINVFCISATFFFLSF